MIEKSNVIKKNGLNYKNFNWQSSFFISQFIDMTSSKNVLLNFPDCMCFTFGLKEMISICDISIEINNKSYLSLVDSFYEFMEKDKIFKKIDSFQYITLLAKLKTLVDDKKNSNILEIKMYFIKILKIFRTTYLEELKKKLFNIISGSISSEKEIFYLVESFINELLSMGYTYGYLGHIMNYFCYDNCTTKVFKNLEELVSFLINYYNDNYDMFFPLRNVSTRDISFIQSQFGNQKIECGKDINKKYTDSNLNDDTYYCHIYFTSNDYVKGLQENIKRVNSILNTLKFYTNSQVYIDYNGSTYIKSRKMNKVSDKSIKGILQYSCFYGTKSIIDTISITFGKIKEKNSGVIEEIYDIMNYSQKDFDIFSNDQFLSKWISLETCASKSYNKKGFDAVVYYVTRYLTITFTRQKIIRILKNSKINLTIDDFIKNAESEKLKEKINKIKNPYYKYYLNKYKDHFNKPNTLYDFFNDISKSISNYLYRIYILRNKYVHSGESSNNNEILRYYLNSIEPFFLDKIIKTLNSLIEREIIMPEVINWDDIFMELNYKYDIIYETLRIMKSDFKVTSTNSIKIIDLCNNEDLPNVVTNIFLDHHSKMYLHTKRKIADSNDDYLGV